jgi:hypothetical protein
MVSALTATVMGSSAASNPIEVDENRRVEQAAV